MSATVPKVLRQIRGWPVHYTDEGYRFSDTGQLVSENPARPCRQCNIPPTPIDGVGLVDECFVWAIWDEGIRLTGSTLPPEVTWACCGHGVEDGYIRWGNVFEHHTDAVLVKEDSDELVEGSGGESVPDPVWLASVLGVGRS